jgi:hypothetical protein
LATINRTVFSSTPATPPTRSIRDRRGLIACKRPRSGRASRAPDVSNVLLAAIGTLSLLQTEWLAFGRARGCGRSAREIRISVTRLTAINGSGGAKVNVA